MGKVKKAGAARKRRRTLVGKAKKKAVKKAIKKNVAKVEPARFTVRVLDAAKKCGPGTSVQLLYRVDETNGKEARAHLVFFDKHGWYCEHGRTCSAVAYAQRDAKKR